MKMLLNILIIVIMFVGPFFILYVMGVLLSYKEKKHQNMLNSDSNQKIINTIRERIPEKVRTEVWRRDEGKCATCGSREKLEYDHIIPVSKGGNNTARNIELLCEKCNREKGASIK